MADRVPFILALLEEHGWDFTGIWGTFRVFSKGDRLPILVEVHDKEVAIEDFEDIKTRIEREAERDDPAE